MTDGAVRPDPVPVAAGVVPDPQPPSASGPDPDWLDVPDGVALTAYDVVGEALTNAVRHADTDRVDVTASRRDGTLDVRVRDGWRGGAARPRAARSRRPGRGRRVCPAGAQRRLRHRGARGAAVRIVIGEGSALFREGLARILADDGHEIVGTAGDAPAIVAAVLGHAPDLAVIDVRMPPEHADDGARAARGIRAAGPPGPTQPIVLLSQHVESRHSVELVSTGAFGYLLKDRVLDVGDFLDALARVAAGGSALDPEVVARLIGHCRDSDRLGALSGCSPCWHTSTPDPPDAARRPGPCGSRPRGMAHSAAGRSRMGSTPLLRAEPPARRRNPRPPADVLTPV